MDSDYPIFVNVSGGRTSGYMAYLFKDKPVKFLFQNTGRERPETYDFLKAMQDNWGIDITWLEYNTEKKKPFFNIVNYDTANRTSTPFEQLLAKRDFIPNRTKRFCTQEMKIKTARRYIRSLGIKKWNNLLGYRADEPKRKETLNKRYVGKTIQEFCHAPLYDMGITTLDVADFWKKNSFDLQLPLMPNGKTYGGNCMGCFWHSEYQRADLCRTHPQEVEWLITQEEKYGGTFEMKGSWREMRDFVKAHPDKLFNMKGAYCMEPGGSCGD